MARKLEKALRENVEQIRDPLAWLLVWDHKELHFPEEGDDSETEVLHNWNVKAIHPKLDKEYKPTGWSTLQEQETVKQAIREDKPAVIVNLRLDFDIDPMKRELDFSDIAHAISASTFTINYRAFEMMRDLDPAEDLEWHEGKEELPEDGRHAVWILENKYPQYYWRNVWYEAENPVDLWGDEEEGGQYVNIEDGGDKIIRGWAYLPKAEDAMESGLFLTWPEFLPKETEWVLTVKKSMHEDETVAYYYLMDRFSGFNYWDHDGDTTKTICWRRLPDLPEG